MTAAAGRPGEGLPRRQRLRARADFQRCYRSGRRRRGPLATLHFVPNALGHPRLGITANRKLGGAVVRHRLKRRVREVYRRWRQRGELPAVDLVVHLLPAAVAAPAAELERELKRLLGGLLGASRPRRRP